MDIVALSMGLSQMKVAQELSVSILKMAMDTAKGQSLDLAKMLEQSVNPHIGGNIDISI